MAHYWCQPIALAPLIHLYNIYELFPGNWPVVVKKLDFMSEPFWELSICPSSPSGILKLNIDHCLSHSATAVIYACI